VIDDGFQVLRSFVEPPGSAAMELQFATGGRECLSKIERATGCGSPTGTYLACNRDKRRVTTFCGGRQEGMARAGLWKARMA
jgi:hypothetical protein